MSVAGDLASLVMAANSSAPAPAPMPDDTEDVVEAYSFNTGLMVLLMVLWSAVGHQIASRTKYLGDWSAACILGLLTGLTILILQRYMSADAVHQLLTFNPADFFTYLLPPIIFYAGLSVKKKQFFRNFATIASFGIFGTYVAFALIALVLYGLAQLPNVLNLSDSLALGVIFAATDSVAVLQVLRPDRAPLLYSLVFGEGVINDATAVALLRAVQELGTMDSSSLHAGLVVTVLVKFLYLFAASMLLGLAFGLGTSFLMKRARSNSVPQEVALIGMLGYLSYLAGELAGLSGIVTLFCAAVAISHYALHNISAPARVTLVRSCQTLSYVSEGAIFIYVGMDTLDPLKWKTLSYASKGAIFIHVGMVTLDPLKGKNTYFGETVWLFCVLLLLTMLGRAAFVFPFSFLHNWWARNEQLTIKEMIVIWWAGLIRGAVSVALVYYYFDPKGQSEDSHRATLIATTLVVVMFSITVFGAVTKPLLDFTLGMGQGGKGVMTVDDSRNPSHLAELIPHHNHSSLDGLSPVDILKPAHDSGPVYAAVGTVQETVFPLDGDGEEELQLRRKAWTSSYDSLPSSAALDDGLDPQPQRSLDRGDREAGSGAVGTFQPPSLTPSPPKQGEKRGPNGQNGQAAPPWPDSQALAEAGLCPPSIGLQNGHANGTRPLGDNGGAGYGQSIEMVEGMYSNGDSRSGANPFGFDSFGNSLAGPGQQSHRAPRSQQQQRLSLGRSWHSKGQQGGTEGAQPSRLSISESHDATQHEARSHGLPPQRPSAEGSAPGRGRGRPSAGSRSSFSSAGSRPALTPFAQEGMQSHELQPTAPREPRSTRGARHAADYGPGESTPAAAFGWTGLDERRSSDAGAALGTGAINRWWVAFDARYMQPVFGGPQHLEGSTTNSPRNPNARL